MRLTTPQERSLDTALDIAVTAGAGSGKTKVLVDRYLKILREEPGATPRNILALTFTEKAALEMKEKVRKELIRLAESEGGRWEVLLDVLETSDVSTIHSFCTRLVRSEPQFLNIDPDFTVLTDNEVSVIEDEVITELFTREGPESASLKRLIVDLGSLQVQELLGWLRRARARMTFEISSEELLRRSSDHLRSAFSRSQGEARNGLEELIPHLRSLSSLGIPNNSNDTGVKLMIALEGLWAFVRSMGATPSGDEMDSLMAELSKTCDLLHTAEGKPRSVTTLGNSRLWGADNRRLRDGLRKLVDYVHEHRHLLPFLERRGLIEAADLMLRDVHTVFSRFEQRFQEEKALRNALDFDDQIAFALKLLESDHNGALTRLKERYSHILIDEFQDTDPRQWRIASLLWDGGARCKLFVVGDPKQSIYGFRSADVRLFMKAAEGFKELSAGDSVVLDRNFRSKREIMQFVNAAFPAVMGAEQGRWGVKFDPLEADRGPGGTVTVMGILGKERAEEREGELAAKMILNAVRGWEVGERKDDGWIERPARFSDIAILLPTRKGFERYEDALRIASIPYQVYKGRGFFDRQEVRDVLRILDVLCETGDDAALASVLKGPAFGLSDEELLRISFNRGSNLLSRLAASDHKWVHDVIIDAARSARSMPPDMVLAELLAKIGLYATAGGRRGYRNIEKLLDWARAQTSCRTIEELRDNLRRAVGSPPTEGEPPVLTGEDAVSIMTVHAAKGLEWPIVIVLGLNHEGKGSWGRPAILDPDNGLALKVRDDLTGRLVPTPSFIESEEEEERRDLEESKRVFYVACTRAKDHLILSGMIPLTKDGVEGEPGSLMALLKQGMGLSLADLEEGGKVVGDVKVRLIASRPGAPPAPEEEPEEEIREMAPEPKERPAPPIGPVAWDGSDEFHTPTEPMVLEAMMNEMGIERGGAVPIRSEAPSFSGGPEQREIGDMVHRVLMGVPVGRVVLESGFPDIGARVSGIAASIASELGSFDIVRSFRELEVCSEIEIKGLGRVKLKGRMDLVAERSDGSYLVIDFKTGAERPEHRAQLEIYKRMLRPLVKGPVLDKVISYR